MSLQIRTRNICPSKCCNTNCSNLVFIPSTPPGPNGGGDKTPSEPDPDGGTTITSKTGTVIVPTTGTYKVMVSAALNNVLLPVEVSINDESAMANANNVTYDFKAAFNAGDEIKVLPSEKESYTVSIQKLLL